MMQSFADNEVRPARGLWWLHPGWAFAVLVGGTMAAALALSDSAFRLYGTPKYVDRDYFLLALAGIAAFVARAVAGSIDGAKPTTNDRSPKFFGRLTGWFYAAIATVNRRLFDLVRRRDGFTCWRHGLGVFAEAVNMNNMDGLDHRPEVFFQQYRA